MSIVGSTQNKEAVKKIGALLLILFVVCCGIVLYYRNSSETSAITEESASFEEPTNFEDSALTDVATTPTDNNELITITTKQNESDINTDSSDSYLNNIEFIVPVITYSQYSINPTMISEIKGIINKEGEYNEHMFSPEESGVHRFEFSDVKDGTDFKLVILNDGREQLATAYDLDNEDGISFSLVAGKNYIIRIEQYRNVGSYVLKIGQKKNIINVSKYNIIHDSIQYKDQANDYSFVTNVSGLHRFEFSNVPDGTDLKLYIFNSGWESIKTAYDLDDGDGITISLEKEKTYYIRVEQYRNYGTYTLNIGNKKNIVHISNYTEITDSIQYTNQKNDYEFTAKVSGIYRFEFDNVPNGTDLKMTVYNSGWEQLKSHYDLDNNDGITISLTAEKTYYVSVEQYNSVGTYTLKIGHKQHIKTIFENIEIKDCIQYTDQENDYLFVPQTGGSYKIKFTEVPEGTDLKMIIFNSGWEETKSNYNMDEEDFLTIELEEMEKYYIRIVQYNSFGDYKIKITK